MHVLVASVVLAYPGFHEAKFPAADSRRSVYVRRVWDVLTWHDGTLSIAWWAVLLIVLLALVAGGSHAAKR